VGTSLFLTVTVPISACGARIQGQKRLALEIFCIPYARLVREAPFWMWGVLVARFMSLICRCDEARCFLNVPGVLLLCSSSLPNVLIFDTQH
jgi:hypothetical protein